MKILLLSPNQIKRYNWGHQLFRNEIGRQHEVIYYGAGFPNFDKNAKVRRIIKQNCNGNPDLIMTYGWRYSKDFLGLGKIRDIPKVHITVDYGRPSGIPKQNKFFARNRYDLVFGITQNAIRLLKENNVCDKIEILPFSADTNIYKNLGVKKERRVLAAFSDRKDIYPNRKRVRKVIRKCKVPMIAKKVVHNNLIRWINRCKITVTSNNIFKSLSMRYTETLACGGFLLADRPEDLDFVGLKDGEHLVIYEDMDDFRDKLLYYLSHDKERTKIEKAGMDFVRKNHSCEVRVKQMTKIIKRELGI